MTTQQFVHPNFTSAQVDRANNGLALAKQALSEARSFAKSHPHKFEPLVQRAQQGVERQQRILNRATSNHQTAVDNWQRRFGTA